MWAVALSWAFLAFFRFNPIPDKPIAWDTLGYYLPLVSTFIHEDPLLTDKTWLVDLNEREQLTGTLYQVTTSPQGKDMYFFFFGWSYCYAPFFAIGHCIAESTGFAADGFSLPYTMAIMWGGLVYLAIALWYWRKVLMLYFDDQTVAISIFFIALGTNFVNHTSTDNLSTINLLLMFMAVLIWHTIRWYDNGRGVHLVGILVAWMMMTLIKPSETLVCLIPLLWDVRFREPRSLLTAFRRAFQRPLALALGCGLVVMLLLPQVSYWHSMTGRWIFDSYQNPGVGLDWTAPHIFEVLFSFRKGWMIYTPMMAFALAGWIFFFRKHRQMAAVLGVCFLVFFYVVASWSEWWYGGGFSQRTLIPSYILLSFGMAAFIGQLRQSGKWLRIIGFATMWCLLLLNQFQWWQFKSGILDPYRTTSAYYKAIWLATQVPPGSDSLKLVHRDFAGAEALDESHYRLLQMGSPLLQYSDTVWSNAEWNGEHKFVMEELTAKDHLWFEAEVELECQCTVNEAPLMVFFTQHKGVYGYQAKPFEATNTTQVYRGKFRYMTPEMRSYKDRIGVHLWNRNKVQFRIKQMMIRAYEPLSQWSDRQ